jgi:sugar phosphate isomerase/epimerase
MQLARRDILKAAALAALPARAAGARYQLAAMTLPYAAHPIQRALDGIRKAGYRYVGPTSRHAKEALFTTALTPAARAELKQRFKDAGLEPVITFAGLGLDMRKPESVKHYCAELDLCAEFGIRTTVGTGPWYFTKFPNMPKRDRDWQQEVAAWYAGMEPVVKHAESLGVTVTVKPHTGITAHAKACLEVAKRLVSPRFKICWDAGNVSFYEGIWPDPDLPDLAPHVTAVTVKDHKGGRAEGNFPIPGQGQIDHDQMFRTLFGAGFNGPIAVERIDGTDRAAEMPPELIDQRLAAAHQYLAPLLEKLASA